MSTTADTNDLTLFERTALEWHHEWYTVLTRAQPSRADQVLAWLHNHVFPFMRAMGCPSGGDLTREQFLGFQNWVGDSARIDLGPTPKDPQATVTFREAIEVTGAARSTIQRRLARGAFPGATQDDNRTWHIPLGDLHAAGLLAGPLRRGRRGVPTNHQQQAEMRKTLAHILLHGQELGRWTVTFDPERAPLRVPQTPQPLRRQLTLAEAAQVAARLHVVHQFALWLMRILGLRKSEAYGLQVRDITYVDGRMFLFVRRQGGRRLKQFDDDGQVVTANFKSRLKTESSLRMLLVPRPMERLIEIVVAVFHTDDTGVVDETARLVPGLQTADAGGAGAFGTALRDAARAVGINVALDPDVYLGMQAKDLRADLVTDLASEDVPAVVRKRFAGHIAGDDVHDRRYVRPTATQVRKQIAASDALERLIAEDLPNGDLMVPTPVSCTTANQPALAARKEVVDGRLAGVGWLRSHVDGQGRPMLTSDQVSALFKVSERKVREWAREAHLEAAFDGQRYLFATEDVMAVAQDLAGYVNVIDLAEEFGMDRAQLRHMMSRDGIVVYKPLPGMLQMVNSFDAARLRAMVRRRQEIGQRSLTYVQAARELGVTPGLIQPLVESGLLHIDAEAPVLMVTRESVQALRKRSVVGRRGRAS